MSRENSWTSVKNSRTSIKRSDSTRSTDIPIGLTESGDKETLNPDLYSANVTTTKVGSVKSSDLNIYLAGRVITDIPLPVQHVLSTDEVYNEDGLPDLAILRGHFQREGHLEADCLMRIVSEATNVFAREMNIVFVRGVVKVVGAVCGQFFDLLEILKRVNFAQKEKCVFLGKYAWDSANSIETLIYLYTLKLVYPERIFLLRSQRETRLCSKFSFKAECQSKYSMDVYECFSRSFEHLPLVAIVNKETMCVHGGIPPRALSLLEINKIDRFREPPPRGPLTDLLWADPDPKFGVECSNSPCFTFNLERFVSVYFTYDAFKRFMRRNNLSSLVRGNQPLFSGFHEHTMPDESLDANRLSMKSLFSAPNFKGKRNQGAMLTITSQACTVDKFLWATAPYRLPNFLNGFTWSLPFLALKATSFVEHLLEFMDRDTAATDFKDALKRNQERTAVLSGLAKDRDYSDSYIALDAGVRQVAFSMVDEIVERVEDGAESWPDGSIYQESVECEEDDEGALYEFKVDRNQFMRFLCCAGSPDDEES